MFGIEVYTILPQVLVVYWEREKRAELEDLTALAGWRGGIGCMKVVFQGQYNSMVQHVLSIHDALGSVPSFQK